MNDNRTEQEKYRAWLKAVNFCVRHGWQCVSGWMFKSPSGTQHDLSAADLTQLSRIESEKIFIV